MENQQKDTVGLQSTEPNTLYQKPTNHARRKPMEQTKQGQFIIRRIGGTTYKVIYVLCMAVKGFWQSHYPLRQEKASYQLG